MPAALGIIIAYIQNNNMGINNAKHSSSNSILVWGNIILLNPWRSENQVKNFQNRKTN